MKKIETYSTFSGITSFDYSVNNTSCSGGTINKICIPATESDSKSATYILTLKELRSCRDFENISQEQADEIIQTLTQLSALCYQAILNDRPPKI